VGRENFTFYCALWLLEQAVNIYFCWGTAKGRGGGLPGYSPQNSQNRNFKNTDFVDIMISKVLRDLPFSRNQPLKSADDQYIRILKNKLIN
jgi:hypothetical protein